MQQIAPTTDALSPLAVAPCMSFEDFEHVSYSSSLLLPVSLPDTLVKDADYAYWCEEGFNMYADGWFADQVFSVSSLRVFILQEMFPGSSDDAPPVQHVGFLHGFLSALAFADRDLALVGLSLLVYLADHLVFLSRGSL